MIMDVYSFENNINFQDHPVNILEIHATELFTKICQSIKLTLNGKESAEKISLQKDGTFLNISKELFFLSDVFDVELNSRKITKSLFDKIEEEININYDEKCKLNHNVNNIVNILSNYLEEMDFDCKYRNMFEISDLLKLMKITINTDLNNNPFENILTTIDVISEFQLASILVGINFKSYFTKEQLIELFKYIKYKGLKLLLVEATIDDIILVDERKLIIDESFDDYVLME